MDENQCNGVTVAHTYTPLKKIPNPNQIAEFGGDLRYFFAGSFVLYNGVTVCNRNRLALNLTIIGM